MRIRPTQGQLLIRQHRERMRVQAALRDTRAGPPRQAGRSLKSTHTNAKEVDTHRMRFPPEVFAIEDSSIQLTWRARRRDP